MAFVQHRTVGIQLCARGKLKMLRSKVLGKRRKAAALGLRARQPCSGQGSGLRGPPPPGRRRGTPGPERVRPDPCCKAPRDGLAAERLLVMPSPGGEAWVQGTVGPVSPTPQVPGRATPGSGGLQGVGYCEHPSAAWTGLPGTLASARPAGCSPGGHPPLPGLPALPFTFGQTPADRAAQEIFTLALRHLLVLLLFLIPRTHRALSPMRSGASQTVSNDASQTGGGRCC